MNFTDQVFVRLADASTRASLFDQPALEQLAASAYDTATLGLEGPYGAVFEDFQVGFFAPRLGTLDGTWGCVGLPDRSEAAFRLAGLGSTETDVRIDAFWKGAIVARSAPATSRIEQVDTDWPSPGPVDPERESVYTAAVQVQFAEPQPGAPAPRALPVAVALLIREEGFSVAQLVADTKAARDRLAPLGLERRADPVLTARAGVVIAWVVPATVFDDADWGGSTGGSAAEQRAQRRAFTGQWLAREGIGLITTS